MPVHPFPSEFAALFGTSVPQEQLEKGLAALKPVPPPERPGADNEREKQAAANVRHFLKKVFPDTLFLVRFSGQQYLNVQSLKVCWPVLSESPEKETVGALLAPFFTSPSKYAEAVQNEVSALQKTFGNLYRLELQPRTPNANDRLWHARRREKLLEGSIAVPVAPTSKSVARKPRM